MKSKACVVLSGGRLEKPLKYFTWQNGTHLFFSEISRSA